MKSKNLLQQICLFAACLLFAAACKDAKKDFLTESKVYLVHSGVQQFQMYDKGDNTVYPYLLDLYKSGALKSGATAKVAVMPESELEAYNQANGTSYALLTPDAYSIENSEVSFSDDLKDVNRLLKINFYPGKLIPSLKNSVLPIKIISSSIEINEEKSVVIINPQTYLPTFNIEYPQTKTVNYDKGQQVVLDFDIPVVLDIDMNTTDVDLEMEIDQDYIDRYNQEHEESYMIPESNMFSFVKTAILKAGEKQISFNVKIFQQYLEKDYMLPIKIKSSSKYTVSQDQYYVIRLNALAQLLSKANWTIAGFSSQEASGEGPDNGRAIHVIDGNNSTFWHSQWSANPKPQPPHWLVIDMGETHTLASISLRPRGAGNNSPTRAGEFYVCDSYDNNAPGNANWQKIGDYTMDDTGNDQLFNVKKIPGRYLRILMTQIRSGDGTTSLAEVNAYGY